MSEREIFNILVTIWFIIAVCIFVILFFIVAPYGRHVRKGWGLTLDTKLSWIIMESVSPLVFALCFILGTNESTVPILILLGLWELHYIHRAFIYPFSLRSAQKRMPLVIMVSAIFFNAANAYINGRYIFTFSTSYTGEWLTDPRFIIGVVVFVIGYIINRRADLVLRNLRQPNEIDYKIPYGGMYRWISCPNYFGEILIWSGWAIATWSLVGLAFAVWTMANLIPRARSHHTWYQSYFPAYPQERKALIPLFW
jgi:3-oxo-5-alpha-steroid 4-dehydrogenase 1